MLSVVDEEKQQFFNCKEAPMGPVGSLIMMMMMLELDCDT